MIHIIIDSTAAVPPDMLQAHPNIQVIPLTLSFGKEYVTGNGKFYLKK